MTRHAAPRESYAFWSVAKGGGTGGIHTLQGDGGGGGRSGGNIARDGCESLSLYLHLDSAALSRKTLAISRLNSRGFA